MKTVDLPILSLLPPPSPLPVRIWVLNEMGERIVEHCMRDCVNCLVLNLRNKKTKEGEIGGMFGTGYWWYGWK